MPSFYGSHARPQPLMLILLRSCTLAQHSILIFPAVADPGVATQITVAKDWSYHYA